MSVNNIAVEFKCRVHANLDGIFVRKQKKILEDWSTDRSNFINNVFTVDSTPESVWYIYIGLSHPVGTLIIGGT